MFLFFLVNGSVAMTDSLTTPLLRDQWGIALKYGGGAFVIGKSLRNS